jgi:hypothetical protein
MRLGLGFFEAWQTYTENPAQIRCGEALYLLGFMIAA